MICLINYLTLFFFLIVVCIGILNGPSSTSNNWRNRKLYTDDVSYVYIEDEPRQTDFKCKQPARDKGGTETGSTNKNKKL